MIKYYTCIYFATLIIMMIMDGLWLGGIARQFYKSRIGDMLDFHLIPAVIFYLMYAAGIVIFVNGSGKDWQSVALYGALLGLLAYATYDLTNLATLKGWPVSVAIVDVAWGIFTTAVSATAGWYIVNKLLKIAANG